MTTTKQHLDNLETSGLLRLAQTHPELEYLFRHTLVQDAAYESLLRADRKRLHQQIGETLEQLYPDRVDELAPILAHHFVTAGDNRRALKYFTLAGDVEYRVYANAEAAGHYSRALDIARKSEIGSRDLIHLYTSLGRVLELNAQFDEALAMYEDMARLAKERNDPFLELAALMARITLYATFTPFHNPVKAQTLLEQALTLADDLGDQTAKAKLLWNLTNLYSHTNKTTEAIDCGNRALALSRELGLREQTAFILNDLGSQCYFLDAQFKQARTVLHEAIGLWRELGNLPMLANSLASSCAVCVYTGEYDQALAFSEEAFQISYSTGNLWSQSHSRYRLGLVYWERGRPDQAITVMEDSLRLSKLSGFGAPQLLTNIDLAVVYAGLGAVERGLKRIIPALAASQTYFPLQGYVKAAVAQLYLLKGNLAEAEAAFDEGRKDFGLNKYPEIFYIPVRLVEGKLALAQGDCEHVMAVTNALLTDLRQSGAQTYISKALYLQGQALLAMGQPDAAYERLLEARAEAEAIGSKWMLWQILGALANLESNPIEVEFLRQQAREIIEYIANHTPAELRASFLNLPQVGKVLRDES